MTIWQRWRRGIFGAILLMVSTGIFQYFWPFDHYGVADIIIFTGIGYFAGWCAGAQTEKKESIPLGLR